MDLSQDPEVSKTGAIRVSDILSMKWKDIVDDRIYYTIERNNKTVSLKTPAQIIGIISYYKQDIDGNTYI